VYKREKLSIRNFMSFKTAKLLPFILVLSGPVFADDNNKETYNWTGVYVGRFVGGASSANISSSEPISNQFGYWNKPLLIPTIMTPMPVLLAVVPSAITGKYQKRLC
jgi:hypothetical protein